MGKLNNDMKGFKREPRGHRECFNEELLYELYKEKPFDNFREFRGFILKHHGVYASTSLITRIVNYQIKKYGCAKGSGNSLIPIYYGKGKSSRRRQKERLNRQNNDSTNKFLKRTDKRRSSNGHKKSNKKMD